MVQTEKGWADQLMLGLFTREPTYDADVVMSDTSSCSMRGYESVPNWPDRVDNDKGEVTGFEHGTDQEIIESRVMLPYSEPRARPNSAAGLLGAGLGVITSSQEAALTSYVHKIEMAALGVALPSINAVQQRGTVQKKYKGLKVNTVRISGEAGGLVQLEAELMGSGSREDNSETFSSHIPENWMRINKASVWTETGNNIQINTTLSQGTQDISSGTPTLEGAVLLGFNWALNNNLEGQPGFGGQGVYQDIDVVRRQFELSFSMLMQDSRQLDWFLNQDPVAIEFDLADALVDSGGANRYGMELVVPRFKISAAPIPEGGPDDFLRVNLECDVQSDGTNPGSKAQVYNARLSYLQ